MQFLHHTLYLQLSKSDFDFSKRKPPAVERQDYCWLWGVCWWRCWVCAGGSPTWHCGPPGLLGLLSAHTGGPAWPPQTGERREREKRDWDWDWDCIITYSTSVRPSHCTGWSSSTIISSFLLSFHHCQHLPSLVLRPGPQVTNPSLRLENFPCSAHWLSRALRWLQNLSSWEHTTVLPL